MKRQRLFWIVLPLFILILVACGGQELATESLHDLDENTGSTTYRFDSVAVEDAYEEEAMEEESVDTSSEAPVAQATAAPLATQVPEPIVQAEQQVNPDTMNFDDSAMTNPFIDVRDDNLSTFAIDVDTGSYTIMRNYLSDVGQLPPAASVRVEEYINFFDQQYTIPENEAFAIHLEGAPAPYGESEEYHLVRIGIQGYELPADARPDTLLIFVIDVSGSMGQDNRLGLVKESLRLLVDSLNPTDRIGIVTYGSDAREVLTPTRVDDGQDIINAIDRLRTEGATNVEDGILTAYRMADKYALDGQQTRLIVLSDGVANVGDTAAEAILDHARRGISLSTFGVGMGGYNDALMEQLANQGDGTYEYLDNLRQAQRVFVTNLNSTLITIAKDAKVQVEFNEDVVERYRLIGYENRDVADEDFRDTTVDAGEIGSGHSVTALYEIRLAEDADPNAAAMIARVFYEDPEDGSPSELAQVITSGQFASSFEAASATFQLTAVVAEYAEILMGNWWGQNNSLSSVWGDAQRVGELFPTTNDVQQFVELVEAAASYAP